MPRCAEDISLISPCGAWTRTSVFELLTSLEAEEWRHKVGVAGPLDGSAKTTTRLLAARDWVCKTRVDEPLSELGEALYSASLARAQGLAAGVWHPEKLWAVMRVGDEWLRLTVCRRLVTLRQQQGLVERLAAWVEMVQASIHVSFDHELGLDVNPANFGREQPGVGRLYYLDDEFYPSLSERNVASSIVARIPEEPTATSETWGEWGRHLSKQLELRGFSWDALREELRLYPLPERFEASRSALVAGLLPVGRPGPQSGAKPAKLTCVLADVHANLPALQAVLREARRHGADSFLFLGDAIGYGPHPSACVTLLAELESAVWVRGNHDHAIGSGRLELGMNSLARSCAEWTRAALNSEELAWLSTLPSDCCGDGWVAVHGAPKDPQRFLAYVYELTYEDNLKYLRERGIPLCFYGHTHVQLVHAELSAGLRKLPGTQNIELLPKQWYLVNPGSVGQPRDGDVRAAYALWDRRRGSVTTLRVAYDVERTIADLRAAGLPLALERRLREGT